MASVTGYLLSNKTDKGYLFNNAIKNIDKINGALDKTLTYRIGIDQSTTCTGVSLKSMHGEVVSLFDVKRLDTMKHDYEKYLKGFVMQLIKNLTIDFIIIEDNLWLGNKHTNLVLSHFRSFVEKMFKDFEETSSMQVDRILPAQWRSRVVDKSKGKGRFNKKTSSAEDLCDIYPKLSQYLDTSPSKDLDSFDALGILIGGERYMFDDEGVKHASVSKTHKDMMVLFQKVPEGTYANLQKDGRNYLSVLDTPLSNIAFELNYKHRYDEEILLPSYNQSVSIYGNIFQMGFTEQLCVVNIPRECSSLYALTQWSFDYDWELSPTDELIMYTFPKLNIYNAIDKLKESKADFYAVLDRYALGCLL